MSSLHDHNHAHGEHHEHTHEAMSHKEVLALLTYMIDHNKHHEEELHELAHNMDAEAGELVHSALKNFREGNDSLTKALEILKKC